MDFISGYKLIRKLGEGTTGEVYLVEDQSRENGAVALKLLSKEIQEQITIERFKLEFHLMAQMSSKHFARVYDFGYYGDRIFFTMENIEGDPLDKQALPMPAERVMDIAAQLAEGLSFLHSKGILHLDLKPSNVFVLPDGSIKIIDFGLAQTAETVTGARLFGTLAYMAPERIRRERYDSRADLYSLGIICYQLLTGENPFYHKDPNTIIERQLTYMPPEPKLNEKPPNGKFLAVVYSLMAKSPYTRPDNALSVLYEINKIRGVETETESLGQGFLINSKFVDREMELETLKENFRNNGKNHFALVRGPRGIGKKRLIEQFRIFVQTEGAKFIKLNRDNIDPILTVLSRVLNRENVHIIKNYAPDILYYVPGASALPCFAQEKVTPAPNYFASRNEFWGFIIKSFSLLLGSRKCVFSIELPSSHPFLKYMLKNFPYDLNVMFIAYTEGTEGEQFLREKPDIIDLPPLDRGEVSEILDTIFTRVQGYERLLEMVYEQCRGNPGELRSVLQNLLNIDGIQLTPDGWVFYPQKAAQVRKDFRKTLTDKVSALDDFEAKILRYCVLFREPLPFSLLEKAFENTSALAAALTDLTRIELLDRMIIGGRLCYKPYYDELENIVEKTMNNKDKTGNILNLEELLEAEDDNEKWTPRIQELYYRAGEYQKAADFTKLAVRFLRSSFDYEKTIKRLKVHLKAIKLMGEKTGYIRPMKIMATCYKDIGKPEKAIAIYHAAARFAEKEENYQQLADIYNDIGAVVYSTGNYGSAKSYFENALTLDERIDYEPGLIRSLNNLGAVENESSRFQKATHNYNRSLKLARKVGNQLMQAVLHYNLGEINFKLGENKEAEILFLRSAELARELHNKEIVFQNLLYLAKVYCLDNEFELTEKALQEAETIANEIGNPRSMVNFLEASTFYYIQVGGLDIIKDALTKIHEAFPYLPESQQYSLNKLKALLALEMQDLDELKGTIEASGRKPGDDYCSFFEYCAQIMEDKEIETVADKLYAIINKFLKSAEFILSVTGLVCLVNGLLRKNNAVKANAYLEGFQELFSFSNAYINGKTNFLKSVISFQEGNLDGSRDCLKQARDLFRSLGNQLWLDRLDAFAREGILKEDRMAKEEMMEDYKVLFDVIKAINSTLDAEKLLEMIVDKVLSVSGMERGFLLLKEGDELHFILGKDKNGIHIKEADAQYSTTIVQEVFSKGAASYREHITGDETLSGQKSILDLELKTAYCMPIKDEAGIQGVIYADSRSGTVELDQWDRGLLQALADNAAIALKNARKFDYIVTRNEQLSDTLAEKYGFGNIIGSSPVMMQLYERLKVISSQDVTVLILGETGVGKDLVAKSIHFNSSRKDKPFYAINCAAVPENLLESELFGYEKGAFTGAAATRSGKLEAANGGTLFLDEIGDMSPNLQAKLLRVLETQTFQRLGSVKDISIDVRLITATNKKLEKLIENNQFRDDLYYRISTVEIYLPPLRERREDIPLLINYFIEETAKKFDKELPQIERGALEALKAYSWPGNIRELQNVLEELCLFAKEGRITTDLLPDKLLKIDVKTAVEKVSGILGEIARGIDFNPENNDEMLDNKKNLAGNYEKEVIRKQLITNEWHVTNTAEAFGMNRSQLHHLIKRYGLREAD
ncbi:sigma 54-interacting transcriptional regulator [bacterium]|nr:sigma 54-interacting transcriptional regulator [bacterium]